ncbi:alpha/beta hydrolase [Herbiconiux sp. CPCC 205716]|uniref:Alpha/beta hydrolase n=1 Tax=Herbiconiux gentiana TaxID=2970912 RepID=A0ABT2G9W4_9MICO|nr:alpha/beta hydrolase [Herbiconiux gentiana]MCS5712976.1 alpha/beta hydrolase [Herbiconiux gentiana]
MADIQILEAGGRSIPVVDEGVGPAVVILTEQGEGVDYLDALAHVLVEEDFRIVRVGTVASDARSGVDNVTAVLDHLAIADAWVGGHGFGGTVARHLAHDQHERVNGVLLFGVEAGDDLPAPVEGMPVLVIQGDADEVNPPANGEALRAAAPGLVSVVPIEGGGHRFPATHVGATSWAIEDYLDWD